MIASILRRWGVPIAATGLLLAITVGGTVGGAAATDLGRPGTAAAPGDAGRPIPTTPVLPPPSGEPGPTATSEPVQCQTYEPDPPDYEVPDPTEITGTPSPSSPLGFAGRELLVRADPPPPIEVTQIVKVCELFEAGMRPKVGDRLKIQLDYSADTKLRGVVNKLLDELIVK